jgi:hypothetical protein
MQDASIGENFKRKPNQPNGFYRYDGIPNPTQEQFALMYLKQEKGEFLAELWLKKRDKKTPAK